jgi:hypothetical protein
MNVYEMEGFLRGRCVPRDLIVNESNAAYLVRKLSEIASVKAERDALAERVERLSGMLNGSRVATKSAEERADALAVENAGFKHALSVILEHVDVTDKGQTGVVAMIANDALFNSETPATDAALAAIREQACKALIDAFVRQVDAAGLDDSDSVTIFECRDTMKYAAEQAINPREAK